MATHTSPDELVFLALGGVGEIGMNLYLYGLGPEKDRQWLMVDCGVTFPDDREPGIDIVLPDIGFIEEERRSLAGILITHAHEDHFGALVHLWPRLNAPIYGTRFTIEMLKSKLDERMWGKEVPLNILAPGTRFNIGRFDVELASQSHSIPETNGIILRHNGGLVFHTSDWKLDPHPGAGPSTDEAKLRAIGAEGVDVLIGDSTNVLSEGESGSEKTVAEALTKLIAGAKQRVAVTTFASHVSRLIAVAKAAQDNGRTLVLAGRAMHRVIDAAREAGYWPDGLTFLGEDEYGYLPPEKVVLLCTGSQGEPRAAMARIAEGDHPRITLNRGDMVIFSSRTIPGNEPPVIRLQNQLADRGIEIVTADAEHPVHASGHPRRGEMARMYDWLKPRTVIPVHGEARQLEEHLRFAAARGYKTVSAVRNGAMVRLLPSPEVIDTVPVGRVYRDGELLVAEQEPAVRERRKLSHVGAVTVFLVLDKRGEMAADPEVIMLGLPEKDADGQPLEETVFNAIDGAFVSIPRQRRRDKELVEEAVRRSVRAALASVWGKKTVCTVAAVTV